MSNTTQEEHATTETKTPEEVTTLYVMGLPGDLKYREVHNLFRFSAGYQRCSVNLSRAYPTVFVTFETKDQAQACMTKMQGFHFDPENEHIVLRIEWAKRNTSSKGGVYSKNGPSYYRQGLSDMYSSAPPSDYGRSLKRPRPPSQDMYTPSLAQDNYSSAPSYGYTAPPAAAYSPYSQASFMKNPHAPPRTPRGQPIQTLFVSGADGLTEGDIRTLAMQQPGLLQVKCSSKKGLVAWLHFSTAEEATFAASQIDGMYTQGMTGSGLVADYAKKPMAYSASSSGTSSSMQGGYGGSSFGY